MFKRTQITFGLLLIALASTFVTFAGTSLQEEVSRQVRINPSFQDFKEIKIVDWDSNELYRGINYNRPLVYQKPFAELIYKEDRNVVIMSKRFNSFLVRRGLSHEHGHFTWENVLNYSQKRKWEQLVADYGLSPSRYGLGIGMATWEQQVQENFCEWWSLLKFHAEEQMFSGAEDMLKDTPQGRYIKLLIRMTK